MNWAEGNPDRHEVQRLAEQLRRIPKLFQVVGLDDAEEDSWAIAEGLRDIHESCLHLFSELVPELLSTEPASTRAEAILYEIGEALRHIRYHTSDSRFFGFLADSPGAEEERQ